ALDSEALYRRREEASPAELAGQARADATGRRRERLGGAVLELQAREPGIEAAAVGERRVRAFLDDAAFVHDDDAVRRAHGREAVRDDDRRAVGHQPVERILNQPLALGIERRRRLVEQ